MSVALLRPAQEAQPGLSVVAGRAVLGNPPGSRAVVVEVSGDRWRLVWPNGRVGWVSSPLRALFSLEPTGYPDQALRCYRYVSDDALMQDVRRGRFARVLR